MPQSRVPVALWFAWALFIVYACTIPFHFSDTPVTDAGIAVLGATIGVWAAGRGWDLFKQAGAGG